MLGLPLRGQGDGYLHSERIAGCRPFGIWPLSQAAQACFGTDQWPAQRPVPQVSIEFDVPNAAMLLPAVRELEQGGYARLHGARKEPRGQSAARLPSPEGFGPSDEHEVVAGCGSYPEDSVLGRPG